jgi:hypothetical protein
LPEFEAVAAKLIGIKVDRFRRSLSGKPLRNKPENASLVQITKQWFITRQLQKGGFMRRTTTALICGFASAAFCAAGLLWRNKQARMARAFEARREEEAVATLEGEGGLVATNSAGTRATLTFQFNVTLSAPFAPGDHVHLAIGFCEQALGLIGIFRTEG